MIGILIGLLGAGTIGAASLATVAGVAGGAITATGTVVAAGFGGIALSQKVAGDSSAGSGLKGAFNNIVVFGQMAQKVQPSAKSTVLGAVGAGGLGAKQQQRLQMQSLAAQAPAIKPPMPSPSRD